MGSTFSKRSTRDFPETHQRAAEGGREPGASAPKYDPPEDGGEFVDQVVCKVGDLKENDMKVFPIGKEGHEVLLVKQKGQINALGPKCTHYGAPLVKSALGDGRLRCQWHGACFNIKTGDIEDFPGLDNLPCYAVTVEGENVRVKADKASLTRNKRPPLFKNREFSNNLVYIVVGGGPSGAMCVESLRSLGFTGRVVFIVGEPHLPYDRVKLSKALNVEVDKITLRSAEFYQERDIEVKLGVHATSLVPEKKIVTLSNSEAIAYDRIYIATGSSARRITAPGSELNNVFVLRTADDAKKISHALTPDSNVVILGSSFIGLEVAAYCNKKVKSVTVLGRESVPFKASLGEQLGKRIKTLFEEKGVKFCLEQGIASYNGVDKVESVVLQNGQVLPADVVIQGVGVVPNTQFLQSSGIKMMPNGTVPVNEFLESSIERVFVGGDVAHAPVMDWDASIGHWGLATYHGRVAALSMLGRTQPLETVPFFWTMLFGKGFRYCGFAPEYKSVEIRGDLETLVLVAFYVMEDGKITAVLTVGRDPIAAAFGEHLKQKHDLYLKDVDEWLATFK